MTAAPVQKVPTSPHTRPAIASAIGLTIGVLTLVQAYFGSGHIPTGAEIAGLLSGAGLSLGSVIAFIVAHVGITKAQIANPAPVVAAVPAPVAPAPVVAPAPSQAVQPPVQPAPAQNPA
jgi:hypothetical protein